MKQQILTILLVWTGLKTFGQPDCNKVELKAQKDFNEGNYFFHSLEFQLLSINGSVL